MWGALLGSRRCTSGLASDVRSSATPRPYEVSRMSAPSTADDDRAARAPAPRSASCNVDQVAQEVAKERERAAARIRTQH